MNVVGVAALGVASSLTGQAFAASPSAPRQEHPVAQEPPPSEAHRTARAIYPGASPEPPPPTRFYGYQPMLTDAVALGIAGVSIAERSLGGIAVSGVIFGAGAPLIHLAHEHPVRAAVSLGLRATTMLVIYEAFTAPCGTPTSGGGCDRTDRETSAMVLPAIPFVVDWFLLGMEPAPASDSGQTNTSAIRSIAPFWDQSRRSVGLALVGTL